MLFQNRKHAGKLLGEALKHYENEAPIWNQAVLSQIGLKSEDLGPILRTEKQRELFLHQNIN